MFCWVTISSRETLDMAFSKREVAALLIIFLFLSFGNILSTKLDARYNVMICIYIYICWCVYRSCMLWICYNFFFKFLCAGTIETKGSECQFIEIACNQVSECSSECKKSGYSDVAVLCVNKPTPPLKSQKYCCCLVD